MILVRRRMTEHLLSMSKGQFRILMATAVLLSLMLLVRLLLIQNTHDLSMELTQSQRTVAQAQASRPLLNGIVDRLRRGVAEEPDLADFLRQFNLPVEAGKGAE